MYFIILFFAYNVAMSLLGEITLQQVAYQAHIAGMVFGFAIGMTLLALSLVPPHDRDLLRLMRPRPRPPATNRLAGGRGFVDRNASRC
jgi:hypothetical protein